MAAKFIISLDLGGTNLKTALLDLKCRIKDKQILSTPIFNSKDKLICAMTDSVMAIIQRNKLLRKDIIGVGLGLPGPIDIKHGVVHFFPNIPGWKEVKLRGILKKKLGLPVYLDNDANLACLAEYKLGAARGFKNVIGLTLGTGVGGGIICDGRLYRGSSYAAGEIGHIPINEYGPRCNCGGIACVEAYIGNNIIIKEAKKIFKKNISLEELSKLARRGNKKAIGIWLDVGRRLGIALTGVVNVLNPDCIVIGGGVSNAGRILFDKIKEVISRYAMPVQSKAVKIFKARLGSDAGIIGGALLVKEG